MRLSNISSSSSQLVPYSQLSCSIPLLSNEFKKSTNAYYKNLERKTLHKNSKYRGGTVCAFLYNGSCFQFWHHLSEHHSSLEKLTQTHIWIFMTLCTHTYIQIYIFRYVHVYSISLIIGKTRKCSSRWYQK